MAEGLASFKSAVAECSQMIPFDILYQFQALVQNGYLLPYTARNLLLRLQRSKSYGAPTRVDDVEKTESRPSVARFPFSPLAVKSKILSLLTQILNELWSNGLIIAHSLPSPAVL